MVRFVFLNYWLDSSFKNGGVFPLVLFEIGGDLHPSIQCFGITILNFYFGIEKKNPTMDATLESLRQQKTGCLHFKCVDCGWEVTVETSLYEGGETCPQCEEGKLICTPVKEKSVGK